VFFFLFLIFCQMVVAERALGVESNNGSGGGYAEEEEEWLKSIVAPAVRKKRSRGAVV
jgi:hypothetical protein